MRKGLLACDDVLGRLTIGVSMVACVFCAMMATHITAGVISRAAFNIVLPGTVAIVSQYYMIAVTFIPLALVERRNENISVEVVVQLLPVRLQRISQALGWILSIAVFSMLTWTSWLDAIHHYEVGTYVMESGGKIILWPSYFMLPLGYSLVVLVLVLKVLVFLSRADRMPPRASAPVPFQANG